MYILCRAAAQFCDRICELSDLSMLLFGLEWFCFQDGHKNWQGSFNLIPAVLGIGLGRQTTQSYPNAAWWGGKYLTDTISQLFCQLGVERFARGSHNL